MYCDSKCNTDFTDIRFTDNDETTELDYWLQEKTDSNNAVFWVEVADDLSSGTVTIYMYYGNAGASSDSDGDATFLFFDDFPGSSLDTNKWDVIIDGNYAVSSSQLTMPGDDEVLLFTDDSFNIDLALEFSLTCGQNGFDGEIGIADATPSNMCVIVGYTETPPSYTSYVMEDGSDDYDGDIDFPSGWNATHVYKGVWDVGTSWKTYQDDTLDNTLTSAQTPNSSPALNVFLYAEGGATGSDDMVYDWIFVRKCLPTEPSHSTWGSEESSATDASTELSANVTIQNESYAELSANATIQNEAYDELSANITLQKTAYTELSVNFTISTGVQTASAELSANLTVQNQNQAELSANVTIQNESSNELSANFTIRKTSYAELSTNVTIQNESSDELSANVTIQNESYAELSANATIQNEAYAELSGNLTLQELASAEFSANVTIQNKSSAELSANVYVGGTSGSAELSANFVIAGDYGYVVVGDAQIHSIPLSWQTHTIEVSNSVHQITLSAATHKIEISTQTHAIVISSEPLT